MNMTRTVIPLHSMDCLLQERLPLCPLGRRSYRLPSLPRLRKRSQMTSMKHRRCYLSLRHQTSRRLRDVPRWRLRLPRCLHPHREAIVHRWTSRERSLACDDPWMSLAHPSTKATLPWMLTWQRTHSGGRSITPLRQCSRTAGTSCLNSRNPVLPSEVGRVWLPRTSTSFSSITRRR